MAKPRRRKWLHNGIWGEAWVADYVDSLGNKRRKQFSTLKAADEFQRKMAAQLRAVRGEDPEATVAFMVDRWIVACKRGRDGRPPVEQATLYQYESHRDLHIVPRIGDVRLLELDVQRCRAFRDQLVAELSRPLAKKVWTSFKSAVTEGQASGLVRHNPAAPFTIGIGRRHRKRASVPNPEQVKLMLSKALELRSSQNQQVANAWLRYCPMIHLLAFTGMRMGELRGLPWENVNVDTGVIKIRQRADRWGRIGAPKSEAGVRDIRVPLDIKLMLMRWKLACRRSTKDLVFPNGAGNVESNSNIFVRCFAPLQRAAGLVTEDGRPLFNLKSLRHFRVSLLIAQGATAKEVQMEMGHASIQMTFDVYGHLFNSREQEARNRERVENIAKLLMD